MNATPQLLPAAYCGVQTIVLVHVFRFEFTYTDIRHVNLHENHEMIMHMSHKNKQQLFDMFH